VTIYDSETVSNDDFESNFLVAESDIGRPRGEAVFAKLKEMNPSGKNECFSHDLLHSVETLTAADLAKYSIVATSTSDLRLAEKWDKLTRSANIPYYNLVCCGLYSFAFVSLGSEYSFK
jgi:ubiquitin-like 1-activating enzyme E1 A